MWGKLSSSQHPAPNQATRFDPVHTPTHMCTHAECLMEGCAKATGLLPCILTTIRMQAARAAATPRGLWRDGGAPDEHGVHILACRPRTYTRGRRPWEVGLHAHGPDPGPQAQPSPALLRASAQVGAAIWYFTQNGNIIPTSFSQHCSDMTKPHHCMSFRCMRSGVSPCTANNCRDEAVLPPC